LLWLFLSSVQQRVEIFNPSPRLTFTPTLDNYVSALWNDGFLINLYNSTVVAGGSTLIALAAGVPAAYSLARRGDRGKLYMMALLAARMLPAMVLAVPLFVIAVEPGSHDTYAAVIAAHLTFSISIHGVDDARILCGHPPELSEAARLDDAEKSGRSSRWCYRSQRRPRGDRHLLCHQLLERISLRTGADRTKDTDAAGRDTESHHPIGTSWGEIAAVGTVTVIPVALFAFIVQKTHHLPASPAERILRRVTGESPIATRD